ncbi:carboxypeptidase-like regulatory domain-containing protein [Belliella sp. DSM 111904]|uniref:Carboxypeptidase-like regulatory domain-containing protein n=1 Tax=Belliella filtrata TaxID=2923435 RepID=A0ABS9UVI5_9BACT|nr:carboxypeptidase-like regulatory domain-containing protein [Belliella filtrata]MCH7408185.1 carboxypeptidase-like regulatory domain-containing protein [Belliella filtrata]
MKLSVISLLNLFCLVSFTILPISLTFGQRNNEIKGTVLDEEANAVPFVSVMLLNPQDSTIIDFSQTDLSGSFKIISEAPLPYLLKISRLGYHDAFYNRVDLSMVTFTIQSKEIELNQYTVEYQEPIRVKSDTTAFDVGSFSDGFERNLEELLKKIPGMTVSDNGTLFFNGRAIDKILVEGDDFFSKNYRVLSRNIPPGLLESVEAIENFNHQKLLKGIENSDKTVLNLRFQKGLKASLFGTGSLGVGLPENYEVKAVLFSLLDKLKAGYIGNINNTGQENIAGTEDFFMRESEESMLKNPYFLQANLPISPFTPFIPNLPKNRYNINNDFLQALQLNNSNGINYKSNTYALFQNNRVNNTLDNLSRFFLENNTFDVREAGSGNSGIKNFQLRSTHELEPDSLSQLSLTFRIDNISEESLLKSTLQAVENLSDVLQNVNSEKKTGSVKIAYLRKLNRYIALQSELFIARNISDQSLDIISASFNTSDPNQNFGLLQTFNNSATSLGSSWKLAGKLRKHQYAFLFHYGYLNSHIKSNLGTQEQTLPDNIEEVEFLNDQTFENSTVIFSLSDHISLSRSSTIRLNLESHGFINSIGYLNQERKNERGWLTNYRIGFNKNIKSKHKIFLDHYRQNQLSSPLQVYNGRVFTGANSTVNFAEGINIIEQLGINWRYNFFDRTSYWQIVLTGNHFLQKSPFIVDFQNDGDLLFNLSNFASPLSNAQHRVDLETSKMVFPIKSRVGIKTFLSQNLINRAVNGIFVPNEPINSKGIGIFIVSAFDGPVNFRWESSRKDSRINSESLESDFSIFNFHHQGSLTYGFMDNLKLKLSYEQISWEERKIDFLDIEVNYTPWKNRGIYIQLNGTNLLNKSELVFLNLSNSVRNTTTYSLLPRLIMLNVSFDIGRKI